MDEPSQNQTPQQGAMPEVDAETLTRCENALVELSRSLKAVNFYPRGHPTLIATLEKAYNAFTQALAGVKYLGFVISKDGFIYMSRQVGPNNIILPPLAREFFLRQIKKIFFMPELTIKELENFLRVIAMEEELFRGEGKAEDYLLDNGVEHIWFNEMKFGQGRALSQRDKKPEEGAVTLDEKLQLLIQALLTEKDPRKFIVKSREANGTALRLMDEGNFDSAFEILKAFWECFSAEPPRPQLIAEAARAAFAEIVTPPMMEHILRQLTLLHGPRQDEVLKLARVIEGRFIEAILDKLATNEALYSHRALIQVLLQMPELSRDKVDARLKDSRWHVVRKMAFLLGEMGNFSSVNSLIAAAGNPDPRVAKEALKSLSKMKTIESTRHLIGLLSLKTPAEIHAHVMRLFAASKEVSVVPTLIKFLKGRTALLENIELYREAVRTLGQIGSQQAAPVLEEILFKRSLLAKSRSLSLSLDAAEALGNMGDKTAQEVLQKGTQSKTSEISAACRKALQSIEGPPADNPVEKSAHSTTTPADEPKTEE